MLLFALYQSFEGGLPVNLVQFHPSEGYVEQDEKNIGNAEVEDQHILCGQYHLNSIIYSPSIFTNQSPDISREKGEDDADVEDDPRHHQEDVAHAETGLHKAVYPFLGENNH